MPRKRKRDDRVDNDKDILSKDDESVSKPPVLLSTTDLYSLSDLCVIASIDMARLKSIWKARCTLNAILKDRGYANVDSLLPVETFDVFQQAYATRFPDDNVLQFEHATGRPIGVASKVLKLEISQVVGHPRLLVFFAITQGNLGVSVNTPLLTFLEQQHYQRAILVIEHGLTTKVRQKLLQCRMQNIWVDVFTLKELAFNKTTHVLQPQFTLLPMRKRKLIFKQYGAKNLKRMLVNDPIARHYGALPGDVFKIKQTSETAGTYTSYSLVVANASKSEFTNPL